MFSKFTYTNKQNNYIVFLLQESIYKIWMYANIMDKSLLGCYTRC